MLKYKKKSQKCKKGCEIMIELNTNKQGKGPTIKVIGVGGGGNNAINRILENGKPHENVQYVAVNTDEQVLTDSKAQEIVQIGTKLTGGYGAGADPETGEAAARESEDEITDTVTGCDMVILTAGMGGGTGTGALPVIAEICRNKGILTVAVVTTPFSFEGESHTLVAENGMESLKKNVDTLLIIPNDKLLDITDKPFYLEDAFQMADQVLRDTINGITGIIFNTGMINLDFNDIRTTMLNKGIGHLGIGRVEAGGSVIDAVNAAIKSPLLDADITGASNIMINSSGRINLNELNEAVTYIKEIAGANVKLIWGTVKDSSDDDSIVVTVIATGMPGKDAPMIDHKLNQKHTKSADGFQIEIPPFLKIY